MSPLLSCERRCLVPTCEMCPTVFEPHARKRFCSSKCRAAWFKTPAGRAYNTAACAKYRKTPRGKATRNKLNRAWAQTEAGKAYYRKTANERYHKLVAAGLCALAGCKRKAGRTVYCSKCQPVISAQARANYAKRKAKAKAA
jgi:hypothetical protein